MTKRLPPAGKARPRPTGRCAAGAGAGAATNCHSTRGEFRPFDSAHRRWRCGQRRLPRVLVRERDRSSLRAERRERRRADGVPVARCQPGTFARSARPTPRAKSWTGRCWSSGSSRPCSSSAWFISAPAGKTASVAPALEAAAPALVPAASTVEPPTAAPAPPPAEVAAPTLTREATTRPRAAHRGIATGERTERTPRRRRRSRRAVLQRRWRQMARRRRSRSRWPMPPIAVRLLSRCQPRTSKRQGQRARLRRLKRSRRRPSRRRPRSQ